jgi:hypothetical protein
MVQRCRRCALSAGEASRASVTRDAELHGNSLVGVPDHTPLRPADPDTLADRGSRLKLEGGAAQAWSAPDWLRQAM